MIRGRLAAGDRSLRVNDGWKRRKPGSLWPRPVPPVPFVGKRLDDLPGPGQLLLDPHQEFRRLESLWRLRLGPIHPAGYDDARGVYVQRQLDLLVLGLGGNLRWRLALRRLER